MSKHDREALAKRDICGNECESEMCADCGDRLAVCNAELEQSIAKIRGAYIHLSLPWTQARDKEGKEYKMRPRIWWDPNPKDLSVELVALEMDRDFDHRVIAGPLLFGWERV